ncbi:MULTISPECIES: Acg family FMN-binding oxidoreductase [unclassified Modestobacter]|uniref:Acg family FMN-binding oxidoreductase n=1 Tax=unclassified Modestobacter TaxID=2643866 RepID=UPI0022AADFB3|nr:MULTISPECIES: hypothetical protein [unclassified Modestobacter]MCZ2812076.1 hypothetical protein [Modestobacter sp. VKM Ac-2979]MCZ2843800.1 hypothetical protein [Modestobacter sp. VKM Ac-2980]MCZ2849754.1 hypothetical protein [Modestobacter sp. VKM Ac-2978]
MNAWTTSGPMTALDERMQALEEAADAAMLAPSVHGSQPWTIVLHRDRIELRADRSRQLRALDAAGRELTLSLGAALFNIRVALAARGWAVDIARFPDPAAPDRAAVVWPVPGAPDSGISQLAAVVPERRTNRRDFLAEEVPDELLPHLSAAAAAEDTVLVPVLSDEHRHLVARLTREADTLQAEDPDCAADRARWQTADLTPSRSTPEPDRFTVDSETGADRSFVVLATRTDEPPAWLRAGEAMERVLLELERLGWRARPMSQVLEVPVTRAAIRSALTWEDHPQMLVRIGFAAAQRSPRRLRDEVVRNSLRPPGAEVRDDGPAPPPAQSVPWSVPVSDGRGGTTWV